jgi:Phytanoyl-CoA dioxygenase (PhyH)
VSVLSEERRSVLDERGWVVIPDALTPGECDEWSAAVDDVWERQRFEPHGYTEEPGVRFADDLLRYSTLFQKCFTEPAAVAAVRSVLGPDIKLSLLNGRRTDPGYGAQPLHELKRRRGRPFSSCTTFWCLDAFTPQNGTRVLPGSHLDDAPFLAKLTDPEAEHPDEDRVVAPRGGVIVFNSHLIHAGSRNDGTAPRRTVQCTFARRGDKPYYDYSDLPAGILAGLRPEAVDMLGLGTPGTGA